MGQVLVKEFFISKLIFIILIVSALSGCSSANYYFQGARGHIALMSQRKPIEDVLNDDTLSENRRKQIEQVQNIREFASSRLKLPKNNSYTSFLELKRKAITWNVIATPKYSVSPIKKCLPIVGCVSYLMYFSEKMAQRKAQEHIVLGHDTHIIDSPAYSTGGMFDDPIVSTMFSGGINSIAQIVFHELGHQKLFRKNDSAFNEAFATAIGEQGTILWLKKNHPERVDAYLGYLQKKKQFFNLLLETREKLKAFYEEEQTVLQQEKGKQRIIKELKLNYAQLKKTWSGDNRFDGWFNKSLVNNAKLALIGIYYKKVPEFSQKLKDLNYDFEKFYDFYSLEKPG